MKSGCCLDLMSFFVEVDCLRYFRHRLHKREAPGIQFESRGRQVTRGKNGFRDAGLVVILGLGHDVVNFVGDHTA